MTDEVIENRFLPGARLREQRERKGLSVAQTASELHIDQRLLQALEEDRYDDIGAPIFVKGHLRNYARLLGLDPNEMVAEYEAVQHPAEPRLVANRPDGPRMDQGRSQAWVGWLGWLFLLVLAVLLGGWWYYEQEGGGELVISPTPERVTISGEPQSPAADETQALEEEQPGEEDSSPLPVDGEQETQSPPGEESQPADETLAGPEVVMPETREAPPAETQVLQPQRQTPGTTAPADGQGLVLEFSEESWVEIYDAEGRPILYDLMTPGTRREISATGDLRVFLGNADGVEVTVGGETFDLERYRRGDSTARFTVNVPAAD